ncbi:MAG: hypothetical protein V3T84_01690 [Phycisphaerales bacterium]
MNRRLFKLALFLVAGATVTTAIAWSLAIVVPQYQYGVFLLNMGRMDAPTTEPQWSIYNRSGPGVMTVYAIADPDYVPKGGSEVAPNWSRAATAPAREDVDAQVHFIEQAHGWPMLSHLRSSTLPRGQGQSYVGWLITVPWFSPDAGTRLLALPLAPIWPGFAINTIFYAAVIAILWLLTFGPFTARRIIRRRRGQCIKCGYDLRGAEHEVCPECGVEVS